MSEFVEKVIVVVGSQNRGGFEYPGGFYVIDFSNAPGEVPAPVPVSPPFPGGCVVDCSQKLAAVGNYTGSGFVTIYDISTPAAPRSFGSTPALSSVVGLPPNQGPADFAGIGSISFYGGYVLAGEAGNATIAAGGDHEISWYGRVALIEISNLSNPQVYDTGLNTVTGVAIFGPYGVVCGLSGSSDAFQVVSLGESSLSLGPVIEFGTPVIPPVEGAPVIVICDFDGTNAVFSDGVNLYTCGISNGQPTAVSGGLANGITSVTIAESGGSLQIASVGGAGLNINGQTVGEAIENGFAVKYLRSITGSSGQLGAMGFTGDNQEGAGEYAVAYFSLPPHATGAMWKQQGQASVLFPGSPGYTLGIGTFAVVVGPPFRPPTPFPSVLSR